jgi:phage baseplate assembly protein W
MATFIGFSTDGKLKPPFNLVDLDLVKQDILNQLKTSKGERVMRPEYGSIIKESLMSPLDELTIRDIEDDCRRIVKSDPRVDLITMNVNTLEHTLRVEMYLQYKADLTEDVLIAEFDLELTGDEA